MPASDGSRDANDVDADDEESERGAVVRTVATRPRPSTHGDAVVRPFGYVHDDPVLVRLPDREAWLGNVHAADPRRRDRSFAHVLSLTRDRQPATTHHHPFADDRDHDAAAFRAAVDDARRLLAADGDLLVHCKAGVSRSAAVLATALAATDGRPFRDALDDVQRVRPVATPNPALVESAVTYLAATHERP